MICPDHCCRPDRDAQFASGRRRERERRPEPEKEEPGRHGQGDCLGAEVEHPAEGLAGTEDAMVADRRGDECAGTGNARKSLSCHKPERKLNKWQCGNCHNAADANTHDWENNGKQVEYKGNGNKAQKKKSEIEPK